MLHPFSKPGPMEHQIAVPELQATDTAGGQWTRLDLNSNALLEEEGAAPDMRFEELREGPLPVSRLSARHDASHEVRHHCLRGHDAFAACSVFVQINTPGMIWRATVIQRSNTVQSFPQPLKSDQPRLHRVTGKPWCDQ